MIGDFVFVAVNCDNLTLDKIKLIYIFFREVCSEGIIEIEKDLIVLFLNEFWLYNETNRRYVPV